MLTANPSFCKTCYNPSNLTPKRQLFTRDLFARLPMIRSKNIHELSSESLPSIRSRSNYRYNKFRGGRGTSSSFNMNSSVFQTQQNEVAAGKSNLWASQDKCPQWPISSKRRIECAFDSAVHRRTCGKNSSKQSGKLDQTTKRTISLFPAALPPTCRSWQKQVVSLFLCRNHYNSLGRKRTFPFWPSGRISGIFHTVWRSTRCTSPLACSTSVPV